MGCGKQLEATESIYPTKAATLLPEFAVEDLPLDRNAILVPCVCSERPVLEQNSLMMMMMTFNDKMFCFNKKTKVGLIIRKSYLLK